MLISADGIGRDGVVDSSQQPVSLRLVKLIPDRKPGHEVGNVRGELAVKQRQGFERCLAPREFEFIAFLARHAGKVCTRRMILENVWGPGYGSELHYLKVYAYRIRRKLRDENGQFLQSDPAVGYRLAARNLPQPPHAPHRPGEFECPPY